MAASKKTVGIDTALKNLDKVVRGPGAKGEPKLHIYSQRPSNFEIVPFGVPEINEASNCGGHAKGSLIELYGMESGGKTFSCLKTIAKYQSLGMEAALVDVEHSFVPEWAASQGVDLDRLIYGENFAHGEEALQYVQSLCEGAAGVKVDLVVVDSTAGLLPKAEVEANFEDAVMATQARMMSRAVKKIVNSAWNNKVTVIFINQIRMKPGVTFGSPEDTPGGRALKFYAHQRIDVRRIGTEKSKDKDGGKDVAVGIRSKVKFVKNRFAAPFGESEFLIYFAPGMDTPIVKLVQMGLIHKVMPNRKKVDEEYHYFWGRGSDAEDTECSSLLELAEWIEMNDYSKVLLEMVQEKTKDLKIVIPEDVLAIGSAEKKPVANDKDDVEENEEE